MEERHWILISKALAKEQSEEEEKEFTLWLNSDAGNKALFADAKKAWDKSASIPFDFNPDVEKAWSKVKVKMNDIHSIFPTFLLKMAAVILLIIGITFIAKQIIDESTNTQPQSAETYTTASGKLFVHLTDGSQVWLNKNTVLSCAADFNKQERIIYLTGEAFFEVARDEKKPFIIIASATKTTVLGTAFNLRACKDELNTELVVSHGKVSFAIQTDNDFKELILEKGEKGVINNATGEAVKSINDDINYLAWKDEKLVFNKTEMDGVVKVLEKYFSVKIEIASPLIRKCYFTGTFDKPKLEDILKVFKITMNIDYTRGKDKIILFGKGCN